MKINGYRYRPQPGPAAVWLAHAVGDLFCLHHCPLDHTVASIRRLNQFLNSNRRPAP